MRGGAVAARRAHNPKVAGSNPAPATKTGTDQCLFAFKLCEIRIRAHNPRVTSLTEDSENTACWRVSIIVLKPLGAYPLATSDSLTIAVYCSVTNFFDICTCGKGIFT